jgi:hypothetical protein
MRRSITKSIVAGLAALTLSAAVVSMSTPAEAVIFHGGGGGGWHGGGWSGGGWRGGGWGGGWRGGSGWGWRGAGWRGGYWGTGWGWGPGWGYAGWGCPGWGWGGGCGWWSNAYFVGDSSYYPDNSACWQYRRVWSRPGGRGRYLGRYPVNVCG